MGAGAYKSYLFIKQLASQSKHPIIKDYRKQVSNIAEMMGLSVAVIKKRLELANHHGWVYKEGSNLRLWSKNQDKKVLKKHYKNDFVPTIDPIKHGFMVMLKNHYSKQYAKNLKKQSQTNLGIKNSVVGFDENVANSSITASIRSISKILFTKNLNTAIIALNKFKSEGLIEIIERKQLITKAQASLLLKNGVNGVRKVDGCLFRVNWDFKPLYVIKRQTAETFEPWFKLSDIEQVTYEGLGYNRNTYNSYYYNNR